MKNMFIFILLDIIGLIIFIKWIRFQISDYKELVIKKHFFTRSRFKYLFLSLVFILLPLFLVNYTDIEKATMLPKSQDDNSHVVYAFFLSFFISFMWLRYIIKLDLFNKEKKRHILFVLTLSIVLTLLIDIPYEFIHRLGLTNATDSYNSFIYCVFGIGLIEESIKLIPLLLLLFFSKAIDEPYDFILYASTSALGFAFIENIMYLNNYGLHIINARALYATVAHMAFSSIIAYGLFLVKFKQTKYNVFFVFLTFFFLAIFSHGFYDFWLINKEASRFSWITTLFFLISVHIWFSIKNNTINMSNFYDENKRLNNDQLKVYLIIGLLSLFMFSYVYVAFAYSSEKANSFFMETFVMYGFIIFYIIATLTKYDLVKGVLKPFKFTLKFLYPFIKRK